MQVSESGGRSAPRLIGVVATIALLGACGLYKLEQTARATDGEAIPASERSAEPAAQIEPRVDRIMRETSDYLKSAGQFSFHAEITQDDVTRWDQKIQYGASVDVAVRRPDRLNAELVGDRGDKQMWFDGRTLTVHDAAKNVIASVPVPASIDEALDSVMKRFNVSLPLADMVYADPHDAMMGHVQHGFYVGRHMVDGVRCHHLAFVQPSIDWQIWIEEGTQMVPRKLVIDYKQEPGSPQYRAVLSDWDLSARLPEALFVADVPDSVEQIEFLEVPEVPEAE